MACDVLLGAGWSFQLGTALDLDLYMDNVEIQEGTISVDVETISKQALDESVPCQDVIGKTYTITISKWIATTYPMLVLPGTEVYVTILDNQDTPVTIYAGLCIATSGGLSGIRVNEYVTEQMTFVSNGAPDALCEVVP